MSTSRTKGKRKYECQECKAWRFVHWTELERRTRPRCMACGSTRLEPASEGAKEDVIQASTNLASHRDTRGDIQKST